jgi:hypothetical protein
MDKLIDGLHAISDRQGLMLEQVGSLFAACEQLVRRNGSQDSASILGFPHVHLNHAAIHLANLCNRFACIKMDNVLKLQRLVLLAPANWIDCDHRQMAPKNE